MNTHHTPESLDDAYAEWLREALAYANDRGISQSKVSTLTGINRTSLSKAKRGPRDRAGRALKAREVALISRVTGYGIPTQLQVALERVMTDFLKLKMPAASGLWREVSKAVSPWTLEVGQFHYPAYEGIEQYARLVENDHADKFVPKGFYVICINYQEAKASLNDGDVVVVERLKEIDGKTLIETTIRRLTLRKGKWTLDTLGSGDDAGEPIPYTGDTNKTRICDLVLGIYKPAYTT